MRDRERERARERESMTEREQEIERARARARARAREREKAIFIRVCGIFILGHGPIIIMNEVTALLALISKEAQSRVVVFDVSCWVSKMQFLPLCRISLLC